MTVENESFFLIHALPPRLLTLIYSMNTSTMVWATQHI